MKVATGIVVDGKIVVEGETLTDGSTVTVVLREDDEEFELTPEEEAGLLESIAAIERGEFVSGEQLLERLAASVELSARNPSLPAGSHPNRGGCRMVGA